MLCLPDTKFTGIWKKEIPFQSNSGFYSSQKPLPLKHYKKSLREFLDVLHFEKPNIGWSETLRDNLLRNKRIYEVYEIPVLQQILI